MTVVRLWRLALLHILISVYSTESVESHSGVICDTHFGSDQTDLTQQFIQEVKTYAKDTIRIYERGMYWLSPKEI